MARSYRFAIIQFAPDEVRGERLNVGVIILREESLDLRITRRLERIRAMTAAVDFESIKGLIDNMHGLDRILRETEAVGFEARLQNISKVGPLRLSQAGSFVAESSTAYEDRVASLMRLWVEPEPAAKQMKEKRSRLFSSVKKIFRRERVLAKRDEGLESHRIVPAYELDDGLVADLVLQNGAYHVIETVDASGNEHAFRKAVSEIAVSALVLERARMRFGEAVTKARLVFIASTVLERVARPALDAAEHQGAELVNWESRDDREKFIHSLSSLAIPIEAKRKARFVSPSGGGLFH
jgi:hypothetical protein